MEEARAASGDAARGAAGAGAAGATGGAAPTPRGSQESSAGRRGRAQDEGGMPDRAGGHEAARSAGGPGASRVAPAAGPTGLRDDLERDGLVTWPADLALPEVVETRVRGVAVTGYPALVDPLAGSSAAAGRDGRAGVGVRVLGNQAAAVAAHRAGLRRLLLDDVGLGTARVTTRWSGRQALALATGPYPSTEALVTDVQLAAIDALVPDLGAVRDPGSYAAVRGALRDGLEDEVHRLVGILVDVLTAWREADAAVRSSSSLALVAAARDVRAQLADLVGPGFVARTGAARLPHLVRYLRAASYRLAKAAENPHRDAALAVQVREVADAYDEAVARAAATPDPARDAALETVRWQLEELRVSLFAQHLGTPEKVSTTRIRKSLAAA